MAAIQDKVREFMSQLTKKMVSANEADRASISITLNSIKYLFAELERAGLSKKLDESGEIKVIEKLISDNQDSIANFFKLNKQDMAVQLSLQNELLKTFLPAYASKEEITSFLNENGLADHIGTKNGKSIGVLTKILKEKNINFKNEVVKDIVMGAD